jgi:hypothetical protein
MEGDGLDARQRNSPVTRNHRVAPHHSAQLGTGLPQWNNLHGKYYLAFIVVDDLHAGRDRSFDVAKLGLPVIFG